MKNVSLDEQKESVIVYNLGQWFTGQLGRTDGRYRKGRKGAVRSCGFSFPLEMNSRTL